MPNGVFHHFFTHSASHFGYPTEDLASTVEKDSQLQYIRYVPNITNERSTKAGQLFIDDMTRLLIPWGVPQTAARLYGYLLLRTTPASLDQITVDLELSKSSASVAARLLEKYTLVRRHGERGSKRALYAASENYEGILREQKHLLHEMSDLLKAGSHTAVSGAVRKRLEVMAEFYLVTFEAMETAIQKWGARRPD
jgi:predicted transcriptional regulator